MAKAVGRPVVPAGAVDVEDIARPDAEIVAERRRARLRLAQIVLADDRHLRLEILERRQLVGMEAGLVPFAPVERRVLVGVAQTACSRSRIARSRSPAASSRALETSSGCAGSGR